MLYIYSFGFGAPLLAVASWLTLTSPVLGPLPKKMTCTVKSSLPRIVLVK